MSRRHIPAGRALRVAVALAVLAALGAGCASVSRLQARRYVRLGDAARERENPSLAMAFYAQAIASDPACALAWRSQAAVALETSRPEAGVDLLREALFHDPSDVRVRARLAAELLRRGDNRGARRECRLAIETDPDFPPPYFILGMAFERLGDEAAALACYGKGLALEPEASDFFERYVKLTPSS